MWGKEWEWSACALLDRYRFEPLPWFRLSGADRGNYFDAVASADCTYDDIREAIRRVARKRGYTVKEVPA